MSWCLLSHNPPLPESLLLPMMVFLTLASELADFQICGSQVGKCSDFGKAITGLFFQTQNTRPFSQFSCYCLIFSCAVWRAWAGLTSPCLTSRKQPRIFEKGPGLLCQHSLILLFLLASHTEAALCYSPGEGGGGGKQVMVSCKAAER